VVPASRHPIQPLPELTQRARQLAVLAMPEARDKKGGGILTIIRLAGMPAR